MGLLTSPRLVECKAEACARRDIGRHDVARVEQPIAGSDRVFGFVVVDPRHCCTHWHGAFHWHELVNKHADFALAYLRCGEGGFRVMEHRHAAGEVQRLACLPQMTRSTVDGSFGRNQVLAVGRAATYSHSPERSSSSRSYSLMMSE